KKPGEFIMEFRYSESEHNSFLCQRLLLQLRLEVCQFLPGLDQAFRRGAGIKSVILLWHTGTHLIDSSFIQGLYEDPAHGDRNPARALTSSGEAGANPLPQPAPSPAVRDPGKQGTRQFSPAPLPGIPPYSAEHFCNWRWPMLDEGENARSLR